MMRPSSQHTNSSFQDESLGYPVRCITDNLITTALPMRGDAARPEEGSQTAATTAASPSAQEEFFQQRIAQLGYFLQKQQQLLYNAMGGEPPTQFILVSIARGDPDPMLVNLFRGQVVSLPWESAGSPASELPTIGCLLRICYALKAAIEWTPSTCTKVVLACENGQTKTGLAVATFLRYIGAVPCTRDGFLHFLVRTSLQNSDSFDPKQIYESLPPSVRTLLRNWDQIVEWETWLQPKPLLLRAITIQGIPVEDQPCVDVYDSTGHHVYGSHVGTCEKGDTSKNVDSDKERALSSPSNSDVVLSPDHQPKQSTVESPWVDDEGFYKVNKWVAGDFCVLCRFGGPHAMQREGNHFTTPANDNSKLIFRFAHITSVLPTGPLEYQLGQVDIVPRYRPCLDPHDFLLTMVWEASWEVAASPHTGDCSIEWEPPLLVFGAAAVEQGCMILTKYHFLQPAPFDLQVPHAPTDCPANILKLLWQLTAGEWPMIVGQWHDLALKYKAQYALESRAMTSSSTHKGYKQPRSQPDLKTTNAILDILSGINVNKESVALRPDVEPPSAANDDADLSTKVTSDSSPDNARHSQVHWLSNILQTHAGDIPVALGLRGHTYDWVHQIQQSEILPEIKEQPCMPLLPIRQTEKLPVLGPLDDPVIAPAVELFLRLSHAGVSLKDLQELTNAKAEAMPEKTVTGHEKEEESADVTSQGNPNEASYHEDIDTTGDKQDDESPTPGGGQSETVAKHDYAESNGSIDELPMKSDARFQKYWKMKCLGIPEGAIKQSMQKDSVDVSIWDLDWGKNFDEQMKESNDGETEEKKPAMKDDPRFQKYWKMKSVGLHPEVIRHAMQKDAVDVSVWSLDWERNYEEQVPKSLQSTESKKLEMKHDPRFEKYWKMKSVGLPDGAVLNAICRDGVDSSILNLDWERNYEEQTEQITSTPNEPSMKEDERFAKYWKMKSVGLPEGAVRNAIIRDKVDAAVLDLDWDQNYEAQMKSGGEESADGPPLKDDPKFAKYWKMKMAGLPEGAIRNTLTKDGLDPSVVDLDWGKSLISQLTASKSVDEEPILKDDPDYQKYFKMLAMGLPPGAIKNALSRDGKDPGILDLDHNRSLSSQMKGGKHKAQRRGSIVPEKKVRRKKIFWKPLDSGQIKENSLWSLVKGKVSMNRLEYDAKEFEDLFTESADPLEKKKKKKLALTAKEKKKAVQVIDGKRSMNGGIILLRLKMEYNDIAGLVENMDHGQLDATQIMALREFLPTFEEMTGLEKYMKKCVTEEESAKSYAALSECEKYMWTMRRVGDASSKFDCMLFRSQFRSRVDELAASLRVVKNACDQSRTSESLQQILAMILSLVNTINTGGDSRNVAQGFTLDALLKLNEAKAFDKKTSVLQYLVKLVRQNDATLLNFHEELKDVGKAQNLIMDMLESDIKKLSDDLDFIREPVIKAAEEAEARGERKLNLEELKEQKTFIRNSSTNVQFNQVDHLTGRTSMERFLLKATGELKSLQANVEEVRSKYQQLLEFFQEDSEMPSNEFFGTVNKFIKEFVVAEKLVEKEETTKEKERRREEAKAKKAAAATTTTTKRSMSNRVELSVNKRDDKDVKPKSVQSAKAFATFHPLAAMLAARQQMPLTEDKCHPFDCSVSAKVPRSSLTVNPDIDTLDVSTDSVVRREQPHSAMDPLAALLAARRQPSNIATEKAQAVSSSAHPLAAMLAVRQQSLVSEIPEGVSSGKNVTEKEESASEKSQSVPYSDVLLSGDKERHDSPIDFADNMADVEELNEDCAASKNGTERDPQGNIHVNLGEPTSLELGRQSQSISETERQTLDMNTSESCPLLGTCVLPVSGGKTLDDTSLVHNENDLFTSDTRKLMQVADNSTTIGAASEPSAWLAAVFEATGRKGGRHNPEGCAQSSVGMNGGKDFDGSTDCETDEDLFLASP